MFLEVKIDINLVNLAPSQVPSSLMLSQLMPMKVKTLCSMQTCWRGIQHKSQIWNWRVSSIDMNIKKDLLEIFQSILDSSQRICTMMWPLLWLIQNLSLTVMRKQFVCLIRYFLMIEYYFLCIYGVTYIFAINHSKSRQTLYLEY